MKLEFHSIPDRNAKIAQSIRCEQMQFVGVSWKMKLQIFSTTNSTGSGVCIERGSGWRLVGCRALPQTNHDQLCLKSEVAWFVACNCDYVNKESDRAWHWEGKGKQHIRFGTDSNVCNGHLVMNSSRRCQVPLNARTVEAQLPFCTRIQFESKAKLNSTQACNLAATFDIWNSIFLVTFTCFWNAPCVGSYSKGEKQRRLSRER